MPDESDFEARVRDGCVTALAMLVDRWRVRLRAFIEPRIGPDLRRRLEADDVIQETIASAFVLLRDADLKDRDVFSWLCRIAELRLVDLARYHVAARRSVKRSISAQTPVGEGSGLLEEMLSISMTSPSGAVMRDERESRLLQMVAALPQATQEILRLRYVDGLQTKEIAKRVGKSDDAIRAALSRVLGQLEADLTDSP